MKRGTGTGTTEVEHKGGGDCSREEMEQEGEAREAKQGRGEEHPAWPGAASGLRWHPGRR